MSKNYTQKNVQFPGSGSEGVRSPGERMSVWMTALFTLFRESRVPISEKNSSVGGLSPSSSKMLFNCTCCFRNPSNCLQILLSPGSFWSFRAAPMCSELINQDQNPVLRIISWEWTAPVKCMFVPIRHDGLEQTSTVGWAAMQVCVPDALFLGQQEAPGASLSQGVSGDQGSTDQRLRPLLFVAQRLLNRACVTELDTEP